MNCAKCGSPLAAGSTECDRCSEVDRTLAADSAEATLLAEPSVEILFDRYRVIEELGRGGMGRVLRVLDLELDEEVALKLLLPRSSDDGELARRFRNELKLARRITHRNVCRVHDFGEVEDTPFITMEYVAGETLSTILRRGRLDAERALEIARQLCAGLAEAHRLGVVHRDLKPQNVVVDEDGVPRIMDFGIARSVESAGMTLDGRILGTPAYMAPEQIDGVEVDGRTDIYALGVILFEMVTGRMPFTGRTGTAVMILHKTAPPPDPRTLVEDLSEDLVRVIGRCLEKEPADRFQTVEELLAALGGDIPVATSHGGATTVPETAAERRPAPLEAEALPAFLVGSGDPGGDRGEPSCVGRDEELALLDDWVNAAVAGSGRTIFIAGTAGSGKTFLATELTRRAQERHPDLIVVRGRCTARTGASDPYLPFREILAGLTADIESAWAAGALERDHAVRRWNLLPTAVDALVEHAPGLLETFISSRALLRRADQFHSPETGWRDRLRALCEQHAVEPPPPLQEADVLAQWTRMVCAVAARRPLLLVLDDLHWIDPNSAGLLLEFGRAVAGHPILVVGTFRQDEVSAGRDGERHPLEAVRNDLKGRFGEIEVLLDARKGRRFIDDLLDTEPNHLGPDFRQALEEQTRGHALFTTELLRSMQERGMIVRDAEGAWVEHESLDWTSLPARAEGVIGERLARLAPESLALLQLASVEGEEFTAEVMARLQQQDDRSIVRRLSEDLTKRHLLVKVMGIRRLGRQRLSRYRFRHVLFQRYLYQRLDDVERSYQHEDVGSALETLFGDDVGEIAVELAVHFEKASLFDKAIHYLEMAGSNAVRLGSYSGAVVHLEKGLRLLDEEPEDAERDARELQLRSSLGVALIATRGYAAPEVAANYQRCKELCDQLGDAPTVIPVLYGLWVFHLLRGHREESFDLPRRISNLATEPGHRLVAATALGTAALYDGDLEQAETSLTEAVEMYDPELHRSLARTFTAETGLLAWFYLSWVHWLRGRPDEAVELQRQARRRVDAFGVPYVDVTALLFETLLPHEMGDEETLAPLAARFVERSGDQRLPFFLALARIAQGWSLARRGEAGKGLEEIRGGLAVHRMIGTELPHAYWQIYLVETLADQGELTEALEVLRDARRNTEGKLDTFYDSDLMRREAEILLALGEDSNAAEALLRDALELARRQGARVFEERAEAALARLDASG